MHTLLVKQTKEKKKGKHIPNKGNFCILCIVELHSMLN
jgi:hypothetical protein